MPEQEDAFGLPNEMCEAGVAITHRVLERPELSIQVSERS
jgi:hypothetical protein